MLCSELFFLLHLDGSIGQKCEYKWLSIAHIFFKSNIWQSVYGWDKGLLVLNYRNLKEKIYATIAMPGCLEHNRQYSVCLFCFLGRASLD